MRRKIIVANWKMYKTREKALDFLQKFKEKVQGIQKIEMVLAPPFTLLELLKRGLEETEIKLAAQNVYFEKEGAYTGEISPVMLKDLGCEYVIVGHSERREHFHETDELINKKLRAALEFSLIPILCVGESLTQRRLGKMEMVLKLELKADLFGLKQEEVANMVIAYEPIWAIGTGETASPQDAEAASSFIRGVLSSLYNKEVAESVRIQYGGSVKPENIQELIKQPDIDGALVGGASLDPVAFAEIIRRAEAA